MACLASSWLPKDLDIKKHRDKWLAELIWLSCACGPPSDWMLIFPAASSVAVAAITHDLWPNAFFLAPAICRGNDACISELGCHFSYPKSPAV